ncbi:hypothetical protein LZ32DRAFT_610080 [Colletotrichum eremochloae]|nr:hypothetical protein LZ32DRAFT_610080 [Colletotrichum eremochloae]
MVPYLFLAPAAAVASSTVLPHKGHDGMSAESDDPTGQMRGPMKSPRLASLGCLMDRDDCVTELDAVAHCWLTIGNWWSCNLPQYRDNEKL